MTSLRDYQQRAVDAIRQEYLRGQKTVLLQSPTGSGKTVLFSYMADRAAARGKRVAILVHRRELLRQASRSLTAEHGLVQAGFTPNRSALIQVASVQTLVRRLDRYRFDFIIVDEAHHTPAASYRKILDAYPEAHVLGVTATPCRADGEGLDDLFQTMVQGPSVAELQAQGFLSRSRVYAPSTIQVDGVHVARGDYVRGELEAAADTSVITGDAIDHYRRLAHRKPAIAFCVSVAHAEHVAHAFRVAGYRSMSVDGSMDRGARDFAIESLGCGALDVLTSCDLISEGVDVPVVEAGILLRPTKSLALHLQQMGRVLRPSPDKECAVILDHAGNCVRHRTMPETPVQWSLRAKPRRKKQATDDDDPNILTCPRCYAVHERAPECPECGYEYDPSEGRQVMEVDGVLTEMDAEEFAWKQKRREQGQARTYEELVQLGISRGYNNPWGWARNLLKARARATA